MGKFSIVINGRADTAGVDRTKNDGDTVNFLADGDTTPDFIAKEIVKHLKNKFEQYNIELSYAEIIHEEGVVDNLITGIREGTFNVDPDEEFQEIGIVVDGEGEEKIEDNGAGPVEEGFDPPFQNGPVGPDEPEINVSAVV